jgi:hypothetical protein
MVLPGIRLALLPGKLSAVGAIADIPLVKFLVLGLSYRFYDSHRWFSLKDTGGDKETLTGLRFGFSGVAEGKASTSQSF